MKNLLFALLMMVAVFGTQESFAQDELEFAPCENKMTCLQKEGFLNALYATQATFGVVNAICLAFPEPVVTKSIVALNAGIGVATLILRNLPCTDEGELNGVQRQQVLEEVCRLTGGYYDRFLDKCEK
jgi:hypothetical protein